MSVIKTLEARRAAVKAELEALVTTAEAEARGMSDAESTDFDAKLEEVRKLDERLTELREQEAREARAVDHNKVVEAAEKRTSSTTVKDPLVYAKGKAETSFFKDLRAAKQGDGEARQRLDVHMAQYREARALSTTAGAGGELAPPLWLVEDYVKYARAGRKFADSLEPMTLPSGVSSVNLPKVTGGSSAAVQASQNSAASQTDLTTGSVSSGITTVAGKQVVSLQLLEQSGIPFDEVIAGDLAADHARAFDVQVISGSGSSGQLNGVYTYFAASGSNNVTWTQATPAVGGAGGFYAQIFNAAQKIETSRYLPPDTIWMHPRRWNWVLAASDSSNRPLVNPTATAYNSVATSDGVGAAQGVVGQIGGLQVITDPNLPTNLGTGTNQDPILVGVRGDLKLWESEIHADSFDAPYADSMGILFRVYSYSALIPSRYASAVAVINGTGSVAPTF